jgi:hypothetical protein
MESLYELWFRLIYKQLLIARGFTACLRPDDRRLPNSKGTKVGDMAVVRILLKPGSDELGIQPLKDEGFSVRVRITNIVVKKFGELTGVDLRDCSPDCRSKEQARYHLGLIYDRVFSDDDIISIVHFVYVD